MTRVFTHQSPGADLPGTVAALARQVLPVSQDAWGPSALERQPWVDEGCGSAVVVHKERLAGVVVLHLPASGKLQLFIGEHVEEGHQVPVVLVALEVVSIPTNLTDHMLQTRVGGEHTVGTLRDSEGQRKKQEKQERIYDREEGGKKEDRDRRGNTSTRDRREVLSSVAVPL